MAHFAEIDGRNIVKRVIVIPDEEEHRGQEYISEDLNLGGRWIQTSYNSDFRGKYAAEGDFYDENNDEFIAAYLRRFLRAGVFHFGLRILTFENGEVRKLDLDGPEEEGIPLSVMVKNLINQLPSLDKIKFENYLEYTPDFYITDPNLLMMAHQLGMENKDIERFFQIAENPDFEPINPETGNED